MELHLPTILVAALPAAVFASLAGYHLGRWRRAVSAEQAALTAATEHWQAGYRAGLTAMEGQFDRLGDVVLVADDNDVEVLDS